MSDDFFEALPAFAEFEGVTDAGRYRPLPEDWLLATSDVVGSTKAIEQGRYKAVNMAGASVISATLNALGRRDLPFVFGGDGAVVAVPGWAGEKTRTALAAVQTWVAEELDLTLRAAIVPLTDIRAKDHDVRVARFQVGAEVSYAMFTGGGASWAEAEMKAGRYVIAPAPAGTRPDLTGLSCRWDPIEARQGDIVSIIVVPGTEGDSQAFEELVAGIVELVDQQSRGGHPVPEGGPRFSPRPLGSDYEARASAPPGRRLWRKAVIGYEMFVATLLDRLNLKAAGFDPKLYRADVARNSDFRKFDDGLKMTVDISAERARQIETRLEEAAAKGLCRYGIHRQASALMTCIVPSPFTRDHMHFVDGGAGGYAMAARSLKAKAA